jgi:hypothetical protein
MATLYLFKRIQPQGESELQQIIPLAVHEGTTWARTKMGQLLFGVYQSTASRMISPSPNTVINEWEHPVPAAANQGRTTEYHPTQKVRQGYLAECYLLQDSWFKDPTCMAAVTSNLVLDSWDMEE